MPLAAVAAAMVSAGRRVRSRCEVCDSEDLARARKSFQNLQRSHGLQNYDLHLLGGFVPVGRPVVLYLGGGGQRGRRVAHDPARPADPERRLGLEPPQVLQAADHPVHERAAARGALRDDARRRERARRARRRARAARARRRLPVRHARVGHADRPVHAGLRGAGGDGARGPRPRRAEVGPGAPRRPPRGADDRARAREARLRGGAAADDRRGEPRAAAQDDVRAGAARLERPRGRDLRQPGARRAPSDRPARLGGRRPPCPPPSRPLLSRLPSSFLPPSSLLVTLASHPSSPALPSACPPPLPRPSPSRSPSRGAARRTRRRRSSTRRCARGRRRGSSTGTSASSTRVSSSSPRRTARFRRSSGVGSRRCASCRRRGRRWRAAASRATW